MNHVHRTSTSFMSLRPSLQSHSMIEDAGVSVLKENKPTSENPDTAQEQIKKVVFRKRIVYEGAVQEKTSIALLCSLIDEFTSSENVTFAD